MLAHSSWTAQSSYNQGATSWKSLDHALFSSSLKLSATDSFAGNDQRAYQDDRVKAIQTMKDSSKESIPNDAYPSDHLPLVIVFSF